jgi:CubicO group peptidase (beta-lactamase class C family)
MQLVERGHLTLDAPVYTHIPELRARPVILDISSDGTPVEEPHKNPITLRTLLTHSSGLCYDGLHPKLDAWMEHRGLKPSTAGTILERFNRPLIFEPGTSWSYGPGIDFAGLLVERVSGKSLEEYMKGNLWGPLGITDMTFSLGRRPDLRDRMAGKSLRDEESGKVVYSDERDQWEVEKGVEVQDCFGGQGVFTYGGEYIKVLRAVLTTDEDEKILKRESVELFFSPQLGDQSREMLNMVLTNEVAQNAMGGVPTEVKKDYGLGGLLILEDAPDGKKAGTMFWGGLPNLTWVS